MVTVSKRLDKLKDDVAKLNAAEEPRKSGHGAVRDPKEGSTT
jgi:hypothetical protein